MKISWTENALEMLGEIEDFISINNPEAAIKWVNKIIKRCQNLSRFPHRGRIVPEIGLNSTRELIEGNYRIVYRIRDPWIEILTVFEGHRQFPFEDLGEVT